MFPRLLAANPTLAQLIEKVPPTALLILGVVLITAYLLMRMRKRRAEGPTHVTGRERVEQYRQQDGVRNDMEGLMVDIEQMAKRLGAQLDAKAIRLEKLLDEADLRIAQLHQAEAERHANPPTAEAPAQPEVSAEPAPAEPAIPADPLAADVHRLADEGLAAPEIASRLDEHVGKVELILALRNA